MDNQDREEIREIVKEETKHLATREEMQKGFDELRESSVQTQATLIEFQASFDRHAESLASYFRNMDKRFSALETRVAKLEERVESIENRLNIMSRQLENLSDAVAELRVERKQEMLYITSLEEKILAERVDTQNEYHTLSTKLNELEARIAQIESKSKK